MDLKLLINQKDFQALNQALAAHAGLANQPMAWDDFNTAKAHPLHRLCDWYGAGRLSEGDAIKIAEILLQHGADINGGPLVQHQDTPLIAASSLHADALGLLYIEYGADIKHAGTHGGTALHWAAWCGRDSLVKKLIEAGSAVNALCSDFKSTPLFWTILGFLRNGRKNRQQYLASAKLLLLSGANKNIPNLQGITIAELLDETESEFLALFADEKGT